jgi:SAM-dependent methyltransferase
MGAYVTEGGAGATTVVNTDQAAAWDGHEGEVWAEHADRYEQGSRHIWARFPLAEVVGARDRVLDVGCGTGASTRDAARVATDGAVVGVDLSTRMLEEACRRSDDEGLTNVTFLRADAQVHPFEPEGFDVVMSSFGVMFFNDPIGAFSNFARSLRPGGTLAVMAWRTLPENDWLVSMRGALALGRDLPLPPPDAPTPFSLADPERVASILGAAGFDAVDLSPIDEPIEFGADAADALAFVSTVGIVEGLTADLDGDQRATAMDNLAALMRERETPEGVHLPTAAWLITARRR